MKIGTQNLTFKAASIYQGTPSHEVETALMRLPANVRNDLHQTKYFAKYATMNSLIIRLVHCKNILTLPFSTSMLLLLVINIIGKLFWNSKFEEIPSCGSVVR